ncbi:MAG TPA: hypothetical protein VMM92_08810 [Thermoanaerobaculia bacterium]|nr:hypothetical protein [Thermoanaerobaculia bacterium]
MKVCRSVSLYTVFAFLAALAGFPLFAQPQEKSPTPAKPAPLPTAETLTQSGEGFSYQVRTPQGWQQQTFKTQPASVLFYQSKGQLKDGVGVIRIQLNPEEAESIAADLKNDMDDYREQYPKVEFKDLALAHPRYEVAAKDFTVAGQFHEYVAYVSPYKGCPFMFSVALNTGKNPAQEAQLAGLRAAVESIELLTPKPPAAK